MPGSFSKVFASNPQLAALSEGQKMELLNQVYDKLGESGQVPRSRLRGFREAQERTLYEGDVASGRVAPEKDYNDWRAEQSGRMSLEAMTAGLTGLPAPNPEVSEERRSIFQAMNRRNLKEDLKDVGTVATDFSHYPKAVAKFGSDMLQLGSQLSAGLGQVALGNPGGALEAASRAGEGEGLNTIVNKWYEEAIKDDPDLYKMYDAAIVDSIVGAPFGLARMGKAAKAAEAVGTTISGMSRARQVLAPIVSNVTGGQLIYRGLEGLDESLKNNTTLTDSQKTGIRVGALLAGGLASGMTVERMIENAVAGGGKALQAAERLGAKAQELRATGKTFQEDLLQNPELSDDMLNVLGLTREAEEAGPKFSPTDAAAKLDTLEGAQAKLLRGEELDLEEAQALSSVGKPDVPTPPLASEERIKLYDQPSLTERLRQKVEPMTSAEASSGAQGILPYSKATVNQRGLASVDALTREARTLDTEIKRIESLSTPETAIGDAQRIDSLLGELEAVRGQLRDVHTTLALANEGTAPLLKMVDKELVGAKKELGEIFKQGKAAQGEEKAALRQQYRDVQERIRTLEDRKIVLKRQPAQITSPIKGGVEEAGEPISKQAQLVSREDVETKLGMLPAEDQLRIRQVTQAIESGKEAVLARALSEEEHLDTLARVYNDPNAWSRRIFDPSDEAIVKFKNPYTGAQQSAISAGYVEGKYPQVAKALTFIDPVSHVTKSFSPDGVLSLMQGLVARSGFGMGPEGYSLSREMMREAFQLWDEIKGVLPKAEGASLGDFLKERSRAFRVNKTQATKVAQSIQEAFPELDAAFQYGRALPKDSTALVDSLTRLVTIGQDASGLRELTHELGHLHFYYGLGADAKLSWLDGMRKAAGDEESWARAFPEYQERTERLLTSEKVDPVIAAKEAFWMHNPAEMYAQQFSSFILSNVIPPVDTLATFGRVQKGLKGLVKEAGEGFERLTQDTQRFMMQTLAQPDVVDVKRVSPQQVDELLKSSWLYSDRDTALVRVEELSVELDATYSGRTVGLEGLATEEVDKLALQAQQGVAQARAVSYEDLAPSQRVMLYSLDDLPKVIELQSLRLLYDLPGASLEELQMASRRMDEILLDRNRPELIEQMVEARLPQASKYDPSFDPAAGQRYTPEELRSMRRQEEALTWNRLDEDVRREIAQDESRKARLRYAKARETAEGFIKQEEAQGRVFSPEERQALVQRIARGETPQSIREGAYRAEVDEEALATSYNEKWQAARSAVVHQLAALDSQAEALRQFATGVMAKKGMIDVIDPSFRERLSYAEAFSKLPDEQLKGLGPMQVVGFAARAGYCGFAGLEYDPEGTYIPFLGHVRWNPEKFLSTPLNALIMPGAPSLLMKGGKLGKKLGSALFSRVPESLRGPLGSVTNTIVSAAKKNFGPNMGMSPEMADRISQARVFGAARKQDWLEFAETLQRHFTLKEREAIARMAGQEPGWRGLTKWALDYRPDVLAAANLTRKAYSSIEDEFKRLGVVSPHFEDLKGSYINRFYYNLARRPIRAIFENFNIDPLKMDFLKRRGVAEVVRNTRGDGIPNRAFTRFMEEAQVAGVELTPGTRVNAYRTAEGEVIYTLPDTAYDAAVKGQHQKWHTWDGPSQGFEIEEATGRSIKLRRDYTKGERRLMGEVMDISVRAAAMGERLERDYRKAHILSSMSKSDLIVDPSKRWQALKGMPGEYDAQTAKTWAVDNGYKLVPEVVDESTGVLKYGPLSGKYVHPDAWEALTASEPGRLRKLVEQGYAGAGMFGTALRAHQKALTAWKLSKTVLSPVAHMNNFVSNIAMGFMLGHNPVAELKDGYAIIRLRNLDLKSRRLLKEGKGAEASQLMDQLKESPYYQVYQEIKEARMADSSMWASEMRSDEMARALVDRGDPATEPGTLLTAMKHGLSDYLKPGFDKAAKLYEAGDLIFKMGAFSQARKRGEDLSSSLRNAYEAYFDYGQLAPGVRFLRDSGIVPFVSYMYKAVPALAKAIKEHPDRVAMVALALEGVHLANVAGMFGGGEVVANSEALDKAMPTYMQGRGLGGLFRTRPLVGSQIRERPLGGEVQTASYFDMSRMLPGGDLWETGGSSVNDVDFSVKGAGELVGKMLMQSPVFSQATIALTGVNPALGQHLNTGGTLDEESVKGRVRGEFLKGFWNTIAPNLPFIPYTYSQQALAEGLMGQGILSEGWYGKTGMDSLGLPKPLSTAMMQQIGIKVREVAPERTLAQMGKAAKFELNKEKGRLNALLRSPRFTEEEKRGEIEGFKRTAEGVAKKQAQRGEMLRRIREARQGVQGGQTLPR